jgi:2-hydroxy-3-keto-5-methylthiopentenyl-1-phosphate phosphatase
MNTKNKSIREDIKRLKKDIEIRSKNKKRVENVKQKNASFMRASSSSAIAIATLAGIVGVGGYLTSIN